MKQLTPSASLTEAVMIIQWNIILSNIKLAFPKKNEDIDEIYEWLDLALERFSNYYVKKNKNLINIMPTSDIKIEDKFLYKS